MTNMETVVQGAAASRRRYDPALRLFFELAQQREPGEALFIAFRDALGEDPEAMDDALRYVYRNFLSQFHYGDNSPRRTAVNTAEAKVREAAAVEAEVIKTRKLLLMKLLLPNGKTLQEATFRDCAFAGGWFVRIAKLGKPTQIVGQVLSEDKLWELWQGKGKAKTR